MLGCVYAFHVDRFLIAEFDYVTRLSLFHLRPLSYAGTPGLASGFDFLMPLTPFSTFVQHCLSLIALLLRLTMYLKLRVIHSLLISFYIYHLIHYLCVVKTEKRAADYSTVLCAKSLGKLLYKSVVRLFCSGVVGCRTRG